MTAYFKMASLSQSEFDEICESSEDSCDFEENINTSGKRFRKMILCKYCNRTISKTAYYHSHDQGLCRELSSSDDSLTNILMDTNFIPSSEMDLQGTPFPPKTPSSVHVNASGYCTDINQGSCEESYLASSDTESIDAPLNHDDTSSDAVIAEVKLATRHLQI